MTEQTTEAPQTFTVDGVKYLTESLTPKGKEILTTLDILNREMMDLQTKFKIAEIARASVGEQLGAELENFERAPDELQITAPTESAA